MTRQVAKKNGKSKLAHPPLTVKIHRDNVGVTLYCPELNLHTCGKTEQVARSKFIDALVEYWEFLQEQGFKNESPYKEHLKLLTEQVLPTLATVSLSSAHRSPSLVEVLVEALRHRERKPSWDADIFGSLVKSSGR